MREVILSPAKAARNECDLTTTILQRLRQAATSCTLATLRARIRQEVQPSGYSDRPSQYLWRSWSSAKRSFEGYFLVEKIMALGVLLPLDILFSLLRLILV